MPVEVIDLYAELLFFHILLRIVNDESKEIRDKLNLLIAKLVTKIGGAKMGAVLTTVLNMGSSGEKE